MALQVWLPLNKEGDFQNRGLADITVTNNGATYNSSGKVGGCYTFGDGSASSKGINIDNNFTTLGASRSICAWVNPKGNHLHYSGTIASSGNWNTICWGFCLKQDNTGFSGFDNGYSNYFTTPIPTNTWTHLCVTVDNKVTKFYKNGVYLGEQARSSTFKSDANNTMIGRETYNSGYFTFNGDISDVRIYDHCLSPKEVKEISKALVLHYPLNDAYVEGTTNKQNCITGTAYNKANNQYGYNNTSNIAKVDGVFQGRQCTKIYPVANGSSFQPYAYIPAYVSNGGSYPKTKTVSFDYYSPCATTINPYKLGDGYATITYKVKNSSGTTTGSGANSMVIPVIINEWNHVEYTVTATTTASATWGYIINGSSVTASDDTYYLYANVQVEEKDHATPFTPSTRTATTVYDCSGYSNNGTITGSLSCSDDSPRYKVSTQVSNGNNINFNINPSFITTGSISFWAKYTTPGTAGTLPFSGQDGYYYIMACQTGGNFYNQNVSGTLTYYKDGVAATNPRETNVWHHFVITGINLSAWTVLYLNRYSSNSNLSWNSTAQFSDIRIYNTVLSADDVKELYNTSAMVCNNGTMLAYELEE